jgi:hypothetical protein
LYGRRWGLDDVVGCALDTESSPATIAFHLNGNSLGVAFELDSRRLAASAALFPHFMAKNVAIRADFSPSRPPPGFFPWSSSVPGGEGGGSCCPSLGRMRPAFADCEVVMLVSQTFKTACQAPFRTAESAIDGNHTC